MLIHFKKPQIIFIITFILFIIFVIGFLTFNKYYISESDLLKQGYIKGAPMDNKPCSAISPECGECEGKIHNGYCYKKP